MLTQLPRSSVALAFRGGHGRLSNGAERLCACSELAGSPAYQQDMRAYPTARDTLGDANLGIGS
jgi:hypothetical protein